MVVVACRCSVCVSACEICPARDVTWSLAGHIMWITLPRHVGPPFSPHLPLLYDEWNRLKWEKYKSVPEGIYITMKGSICSDDNIIPKQFFEWFEKMFTGTAILSASLTSIKWISISFQTHWILALKKRKKKTVEKWLLCHFLSLSSVPCLCQGMMGWRGRTGGAVT